MPTVATPAQEHQEQWDEITADPTLRDLPYKVETNAQGQIVLSPHTNHHSDLQGAVQELLRTYAPDGHAPPEYALATPRGVKAPDVVWMSPGRRKEMRETGDPSTLAPEICVEVMSESNTEEEMQEKRSLYREIGAEEVWVVGPEGDIRFFGDEERQASALVPDFPTEV
ncbi:MAG: Uma2 family endonuclease [Salinibacter sp.]|uniref:Uma2 family endonuclease n=1 Tax=Salinibacter sp. TaxID=2065818 RepID=UPI002FC2E954